VDLFLLQITIDYTAKRITLQVQYEYNGWTHAESASTMTVDPALCTSTGFTSEVKRYAASTQSAITRVEPFAGFTIVKTVPSVLAPSVTVRQCCRTIVKTV